jgi:hypothetical protein
MHDSAKQPILASTRTRPLLAGTCTGNQGHPFSLTARHKQGVSIMNTVSMCVSNCRSCSIPNAGHLQPAFAIGRLVHWLPPPVVCCMHICNKALALSEIRYFPRFCALATTCNQQACPFSSLIEAKSQQLGSLQVATEKLYDLKVWRVSHLLFPEGLLLLSTVVQV